MTSDVFDDFDYIFYWEDTTVRSPDNILKKLSERYRIINKHSIDISKTHVEEVFTNIFHYTSFIDPKTHKGVAVKKIDINGRHIWEIIHCPIKKREPGFVYQKLINSKVTNGCFSELRVYVCGNNIPFVLEELKSTNNRSKIEANQYNFFDPTYILTSSEIVEIQKFIEEVKLDYGELDVIRDEIDQRIYIIDVNNTPHLGKETRLSKADRKNKDAKFKEVLTDFLKFYKITKGDKILIGQTDNANGYLADQ